MAGEEKELPELDPVRDNATADDFKTKNKVYELILYTGPELEQLDNEVDVLRHLVRLAADPQYTRSRKPCLPLRKYENISRKINEIGCMIGGYYKSLKK